MSGDQGVKTPVAYSVVKDIINPRQSSDAIFVWQPIFSVTMSHEF